MENKNQRNKIIIKWVLVLILTAACLAGVIYESVMIGSTQQHTKLRAIHIGQYLVMMLAVFLPVVLEKLKFEVGTIIWISFYVFVFFAVFVGSILKVYDKFAQFDVVIHTLSGVLLVLVAFSLARPIKNPYITFVFVVAIAVLAGVVWEIYEFSFDKLLGLNMQRTSNPATHEPYVEKAAIWDTMIDLVCDLSGAIVCALAITPVRHKLKNSILISKKAP